MRRLNVIVMAITMVGNVSAAEWKPQQDTAKPEVGQMMPDFVLHEVRYFSSKTASLSQFKGKWLFLDFWSVGCVNCIQSFPKVNSFVNEFSDNVTWMMVGLNDTKNNKNIALFYEKARTKQKLKMPVAYDSVLVKKWNIRTIPYIIVVDPQGVVRFITDGRDMTAEKIRNLLTGNAVAFFDLTAQDKTQVRQQDTVRTNGEEIVFSSILEKSSGGQFSGGIDIDSWLKWPADYLKDGYGFKHASLGWIYKHAYFGKPVWDFDDPMYGKIYAAVHFEVKDPSRFDRESPDARYNYCLKLPVDRISKDNVMKAMQDDLKRAFGYNVSIEQREITVWKLIAKTGAIEKLKTKGGEKYASPGSQAMGFTVRNHPSYALIGLVSFYMQEKFDNPYVPFIDATGLEDNFDLTLDADMTNFDDVQRALRRQGLELVKGTQRMQQLVIRE